MSGTVTLTTIGTGNSTLVKAGSGRWILTASNNIVGGVTVNAGTLVAQNNTALGTAAVTINGGVLTLANGITLGSSSMNLNNTGTLNASDGTGVYNNTITVNNTATGVGLAAAGAADVLSIGNAVANKFTGGAASTVTTVSGNGTVFLTAANNYAGTFAVNFGTLKLGDAAALGSATTAGVTFGASSTGVLQLNGTNPTLAALSSNATPGSAAIENGLDSLATLTVNNSASNSFFGSLRDGVAGVLALVKGSPGALTFSGPSTYTGGTMVTGGTLNVANSSGSATGSGPVAVNVGTLGGTGIISGNVSIATGAHLSPGIGAVGTLTVGTLSLSNGSLFDYEFGSGVNDLTVVSSPNGLTLDGGVFSLFTAGGTNPFSSVGTYNLIQYSGTIGGLGLDSSWTTSSPSNSHIGNPQGGVSYAFGSNGNFLTLQIAFNSLVDTWNVDADGNWQVASNWTPGSHGPGGVGGGVGFPVHFLNAITAPRTITVNANEIAGGLDFGNFTSSYTLGPGGGTVTLNNNGAPALISVLGTHVINAPMALTAGGAVATVTAGSLLTISAPISQTTAAEFTKAGPGGLILSGGTASTYSGGTHFNGGVTTFSNLGNLGTGGVSFDNATLQWAAGNTGDLSTRVVTIDAGGATFDTNGNDITFANSIGNNGVGALTKIGAGVLTLTGTSNTYFGATTIRGGGVVFDSLNNFGLGTELNVAGAKLKWAPASTTDISTRTVTIGVGGVDFDTNGNDVAFTLPIGNGGSGGVTKSGLGKLTVASGNTFGGGTTISAGTLVITADTALGTVPGVSSPNVTIAGGASLQVGAAALTLNANRGIVLSGGTAVIDTNGNALTVAGTVSGAGVLNKIGAGTLTLNGAGSFASAVVDGGTLSVGATGTPLGTGLVTLNSAQLTGIRNFGNELVINGTNTLNSGDAGGVSGINKVSGAGTLQLNVTTGNLDLRGDLTTFLGTLRLTTANSIRLNGTTGGAGATFDFGNGFVNVRNSTAAFNFGALAGTGGGLSGNTSNTVNTTFTVGAKNVASTYGGVISNGTTANVFTALTKTGTEVLTLTGASLYSGLTTISSGALQLGDGTAGHDGTIANSLSIVNNGTLIYNRFGTALTYSGVISGPGNVQKLGVGTQTLAAQNAYTGMTIVDAGALIISGSIVGSATAVNSGGTLGGGGSVQVTGNVTLASGAQLAPGNILGSTVGTLTVNAAQTDLSGAAAPVAAAAFKFELGTASDLVNVTSGSLSIGTGVLEFDDFVFTDTGGFGNSGTYTLFQTTTPLLGSLGANVTGNLFGFTSTLAIMGNNLVLQVVPEPSSAVALMGGIGMLLGLRRRRSS